LKYVVDSGISAIELMGGPVNDYAMARTGFKPMPVAGRVGGGGRGGGRGGRGGAEAPALSATWNGVQCAPASPGEDPVMGTEPLAMGGGRGRGGEPPSAEQIAAAEAERKWR